jgi:hypothetical protein
MSDDEVMVLVLCLIVALIVWIKWLVQLTTVHLPAGRRGPRRLLLMAPLVTGVVTLLVLRFYASHDVQNDAKYIFFYLVFAAAWVGAARWFVYALGICARDDGVERHNWAAAAAWFGALQALGLCFAGGNIGDGPGWWVVVYAAMLSTATLLLFWAIYEKFTHAAEAVTVERDLAAGLRLAGWLMATGLILGAAVAGDWISPSQTNIDFVRRAWPVVLLLIGAVLVDRLTRPSPGQLARPTLSHGAAPLVVYLIFAFSWVAVAGLEA